MSVKYEDMSEAAMIQEGKNLIAAVVEVKVSQDVEDLIQHECDTAFTTSDACPSGTDIVYLPDVSGSMTDLSQGALAPWDQQLAFSCGMLSQAMTYDQGGIDVWPIRDTTQLERLSNPEIERKINVTNPDEVVQYITGYRNKLGSTPTRSLYAHLVTDVVQNAIADPNVKRTLFLISTDGKPDDKGPLMHETTNQAVMALCSKGLDPKRYLAVSYIILTEDFHTMASYLKLENRVKWSAGGKTKECDVANAMFPVLAKALGGFRNKTAVNIALGGAISSEIDTALENILGGRAKDLMRLMEAYVAAGHAEDY